MAAWALFLPKALRDSPMPPAMLAAWIAVLAVATGLAVIHLVAYALRRDSEGAHRKPCSSCGHEDR